MSLPIPYRADTFKSMYVDSFEKYCADIAERIKAWDVNIMDINFLDSYSTKCDVNRFTVGMYLARYAPINSREKEYGYKILDHYIEACFTQGIEGTNVLLDGIVNFLKDSPSAFKRITDTIRSWEYSQADIARRYSPSI